MSSDWAFPAVPPELKSLAPYFQRAQELRVKDPVMAYWCTYYAAKQGISLTAQSKDARPFLFQVMSILEQMKVDLGDSDPVSDDDAGAVYIENFALRVFNMADNEDRREQATRSTAKKFLASANFFELLHIFDKPVEADIEEKIRYAKWKAADLAKAFREGRKPIPGDANAPSLNPSLQPTALEPSQDAAPSMSAWSPGTSLAPSPAVPGIQSLEPSPISSASVPLPNAAADESSSEPVLHASSPERASLPMLPDNDVPSTPSPRSFCEHLSLNHDRDGFVTPGMWSTMATPGIDDVYQASDAMGGISESPSARAAARRTSLPVQDLDEAKDAEDNQDAQEDSWSTVGNRSMSRQNSWTVADNTPPLPGGVIPPPPPSGIGLGLQPDGMPPVTPVKKVHFSPSVVGGLSSTSSSIAGSSPPASPEGYVPSLPTVQEAAYSSDSERDVGRKNPTNDDATMHPLPESGSSASETASSPQGAPPVIHKLPSPTGPLSPNGLSSSHNILPIHSPQLPQTPLQKPASRPHTVAPVLPQFPAAPSQQAGLSPRPHAPPALHPTPRFVATPLVPAYENIFPPSTSPSPPPELNSTEVARIQKHCRFAISALDYEDAETARKELRLALAMLGG